MIEKKIFRLLAEKGLTLSSAESCTGGLFAHKITNIPGSSRFFTGGVVTYSEKSKHKILKIKKDLLAKYGTVSKQCAQKMAENCRKIFSSHISVGITGVAGPDKLEGKPPGTVYIAIATGGKTYVKKYKFQGRRTTIKTQTVKQAFLILMELLKNGSDTQFHSH